MHNKEQLLFYLESYLGEGRNTSKDNYAFSCPICHNNNKHNKRKLEVDLESYRYHCWTCMDPITKGSNFIYLLMRLGATKLILDKVKSFMNQEILAKWTEQREEKPKIITYKAITLPDEYKTFEGKLDLTGLRAYKFLTEERGLTDGMIKAFKIGYCSTGKYFGRVILPIFDSNGTVVYFNARNILTEMKDRVKYYDPLEKGSSIIKMSLVPMEFFINKNKPIVLVEGLFDFYNTPNAIPIMGTNILPGVLHFLLSDEISEIILALDGGTTPKMIRYANTLRSFGKRVKYVRLNDEEDPGSLNYNTMRSVINKDQRYLDDLETLRLKLYG